jgi:hypothetical protein
VLAVDPAAWHPTDPVHPPAGTIPAGAACAWPPRSNAAAASCTPPAQATRAEPEREAGG